jgi:hypothetical protein
VAVELEQQRRKSQIICVQKLEYLNDNLQILCAIETPNIIDFE